MNLAADLLENHFEADCFDSRITKKNFLEIREFLAHFRCNNRIFIPGNHFSELKNLFKSKVCLLLNLSQTNPMSTMETIVLALSFLLNTKDIAFILMSTPSTIETYIKRIKLKLDVKVKSAALYRAIQCGYIKVVA